MLKDPVKVREQEVSRRVGSFEEVVLGYNEKEALEEAARCLQCKVPACQGGCPVGIDIKSFIKNITDRNYDAAYLKIKETNNFPSICGRVCPAEYQCRKACVLTKKGSPFADKKAINIHFLERFVGDHGIKKGVGAYRAGDHNIKEGPKVALVGSGPASLSCAGELGRRGVKSVIFESLHRPGGVLAYGIPPFRLPQSILDQELEHLKRLGVELRTNLLVGAAISLDELFKDGFKCVFLGLGAGTPGFLNLPGENLCNIYSANEFLTRVNLMGAYRFPEYHTPVHIGKHIVIIGGGNTAMDAARVAVRLQAMNKIASDVTVLYRRTDIELPARRLEIEHAMEEGIKFKFLAAPLEFKAGEGCCVGRVRGQNCELGPQDSSGRRRPVPIDGSYFEIDCDMAVIAVGLGANQILTRSTPSLKLTKYGDIIVNPETMETSVPGVFAGGDIVGGEGTVIEAMGMGKKAAASILKMIGTEG